MNYPPNYGPPVAHWNPAALFPNYTPVQYVHCGKCVEMQVEMRNMDAQMKLMSKNIELLNEQLKLYDVKLALFAQKKNNNNNNRKRQSGPPPSAHPTQQMFPFTPPGNKNGLPTIVMQMDDAKQNGGNMGLLGSIFSLIDRLEKTEKKPDTNICDDDEADDVSECGSDDEYEELGVEIKTIDDVIKLGEDYIQLQKNKPVEQPVEQPNGETPDKQELSQALDTVVEYITDKVAQKVSQNISSQSSDSQQNGFDSINKVAETMATTGGKKRRTRRFKIKTNKNKTRHLA